MKKLIATWVHLTNHTQGGGLKKLERDGQQSQINNWRCMVVFFESSLRYNQDAEHLLFTNAKAIPSVDGFNIEAYLRANNIRIVRLDNQFSLPKGYCNSWRSRFYTLSILDYLKQHTEEEDKVLLLDSDCIFRKPMDDAFELLDFHEAITYEINYEETHNINGLNRIQMQEVFSDLGLKLDSPPHYSGAEVLFAKGKFIQKIAKEITPLYYKSLERFKQNKLRFKEEAHTLSFFYHKHHAIIGGMNKYIRRLWTNPNILRNATEADRSLYIWHLPNERKNGLRDLYKLIVNGLDLKNEGEGPYQRLIYKKLFDEKRYFTLMNRLRDFVYHLRSRYRRKRYVRR